MNGVSLSNKIIHWNPKDFAVSQNFNKVIRENEKEGISEREVRNEIAYAVSLALKSSDPKIQNFWKKVPCEGHSPTIEEIIDFIVTGIATHK